MTTVLEAGLTEVKFFPVEAAGGAPYLKSVGAPVAAGDWGRISKLAAEAAAF